MGSTDHPHLALSHILNLNAIALSFSAYSSVPDHEDEIINSDEEDVELKRALEDLDEVAEGIEALPATPRSREKRRAVGLKGGSSVRDKESSPKRASGRKQDVSGNK